MSGGPSVLQVLQPADGGVAEHVLRLSLGLAERGWRVEVVTGAESAIRERLEDAGIRVHTLPLVRPPGSADLRAARDLRALDRAGGFDVVHGHSSKAGALVRAALPRAKRLVYTPHCFSFAADLGRGGAAYALAEQALVPRSGQVVAACDWERRAGEERLRGLRSRIRTIHYGVLPCAGADPDPDLVAFAGGEPLAGMVSVLRPQKDPLTLVRAAAGLSGPGRVAIVGNGDLAGDVAAEIERLGAGERIRLFPFRGTSAPYLSALDLFVLPSRWESLPIAIPEAMVCGLPVLSTTVCGIPEAVEDGINGRLVPPGDVDALRAALEGLLSDPAGLRRMGAAGAERASERFTLPRMVDEIEGLYRELMAQSR